MSFDPALFDSGVFGSQSQFSGHCLFDEAVFDAALFDVCEELQELPPRVTYQFRPGYIAPRRRKKRDEPPAVVELAIEKHEVKYTAVKVFYGDLTPVMQAVDEVTRLIEARARNRIIQTKIAELEEEEDIVIILSQLQ